MGSITSATILNDNYSRFLFNTPMKRILHMGEDDTARSAIEMINSCVENAIENSSSDFWQFKEIILKNIRQIMNNKTRTVIAYFSFSFSITLPPPSLSFLSHFFFFPFLTFSLVTSHSIINQLPDHYKKHIRIWIIFIG